MSIGGHSGCGQPPRRMAASLCTITPATLDNPLSRLVIMRFAQCAALLLLAGCQVTPASGTAIVARETAHKREIAKPHRRLTHHAVAPAEIEPAQPKPTPVNLIGLSPEQLEEVLGTPRSKSEDGPNQRWEYGGENCTLSVSLYPDVNSREFRSLSYEVSGNDHTEQGDHHCLARLANRPEHSKQLPAGEGQDPPRR